MAFNSLAVRIMISCSVSLQSNNRRCNSELIANNIQAELKKENKKQVDLAERIGVSKQTMSKIMNGARAINAIELHNTSLR